MKERFQVYLLEEAKSFVLRQDSKTQERIAFQIEKSKLVNDSKAFKKLTKDIWEYRIKSMRTEIRLLAFWDKRSNAFVVCTHGFVKKTQKIPKKEIEKATKIKNDYFNNFKLGQ